MFLRRKFNQIIELLNYVADSLSDLHVKVDRLTGMGLNAAKKDKAMAQAQEDFKRELEELKTAVDTYTTTSAEKITAAVEAARAAWEEENEAAFQEAAATLDELAKKLEGNKPVDPVDGGTPVPSGF